MRRQDLFVEVEDNLHLHIIEYGKGNPVLLLPGLPMSAEIFRETAAFLEQRGFRAICITPRGFGTSDNAENYDIDVQARDIHAIIETLQLKDITLLGYSYGGVLASYYQSKYFNTNVDKLILVSANVPRYSRAEDFPCGVDINLINQLITLSEENLFEMLDVYGPVFQLDEDFMPRTQGDWITSINRQTNQQAMTAGIHLLRDFDLRPILKNVTIPTTIFHGTDDKVVPFEIAVEASNYIKNSTLIPFEKGGHWFLFTENDSFNNELLKVLS